MTLPTRKIGPFEVSAISLGCMNLNHAYGGFPTEEEKVRLLNHALDIGVTMLDTAALYGGGTNEELIGRAVSHRRSEYVLASKCVLGMFDGKRGLNGSPEAITSSIDDSLKRLQTDHIDLMQMHRLDAKVPIEESMGALVRAKEAGKIGAIGLSEMSAATIRRAAAVHPIVSMQSEYSPAVRNPEVAVLDECRVQGAALIAFSPVGRGMLAGSVRSDDYEPQDLRRGMPRFVEPRLSRNLPLVDRFDALAAEAGFTPAQLSLAWVLAQAPYIVAIPGTKTLAHLDENVATLSKQAPADLIAAVTAMFPPNVVEGARYSAAAQAQIDTELLPDEELETAA